MEREFCLKFDLSLIPAGEEDECLAVVKLNVYDEKKDGEKRSAELSYNNMKYKGEWLQWS